MLTRIRKSIEEKDEGFTLIELLVVIIIIGILAAIAIPTFLNQRKKGYDSAVKSALKNAATAQESHLSDNPAGYIGNGSTELADLQAQGYNPGTSVTLDVIGGNATRYCMSAVHVANTGAANTWYLTNDPAAVVQGEPYKASSATPACTA